MRNAPAHSLRFRFAIASLLWVGIGTLVAGFVIAGLYRRHVTHTFTSDLTNHLDELVSLTTIASDGTPMLDRPLSDPRFQERRSGFYWQVEQKGRPALTSTSLDGHHLAIFQGSRPGEPFWTEDHRERLLRIDRRANGEMFFSITASGQVLDHELNAFHLDLAVSLTAFAALMLVGAAVQVQYGLRPTRRLTTWIGELRRGARTRLPDEVPSEFADIVHRLNELLEAQSVLISRARVEAGNLGHNLRTPLALIASEAEQLREAGHDVTAQLIFEQCHRMQRQIDYQMKRAAAAGARGVGHVPDLVAFLVPIMEAMQRLHADRHLSITTRIPATFDVACDPGDLAEILSNLIDNACKWASSVVRISARQEAGRTAIWVEDDGPGIPLNERPHVLDIGVRLDDTKPGSGLGLPISRDLALLYDGEIALETSGSGSGLRAGLILPC